MFPEANGMSDQGLFIQILAIAYFSIFMSGAILTAVLNIN